MGNISREFLPQRIYGRKRTLAGEGYAERFDVWEQSFKTVEGEVLTILTFKDQKMFDDTTAVSRWG
jgi:hypothetical protein